MAAPTPAQLAKALANRYHAQWALAFCLQHFNLPAKAVDAIDGKAGYLYLLSEWERKGYALYDNPLYALRQEVYHTGRYNRRLPSFFARIPHGGTLLDWGCGTAELERLDWIEQGGKTILVDVDSPNFGYTKAKYPQESVRFQAVNGKAAEGYDALLCCHVFEHIEKPIETMRTLWDGLAPGGHALLWFDQRWPAPGHLIESVGQYPQYMGFLKKHATVIHLTDSYDWVQKPKRRRWWGWSLSRRSSD